MNDYIVQRCRESASAAHGEFARGLEQARTDAEESFLPAPGTALGQLLTTLAAAGASPNGAVAVTPAAGVVGLHILHGLSEKATLTCIEPEAEHQTGAREAFRTAGFAPARARFLTARPLDVMGRLAPESYHLVYADVAPVELSSMLAAAWPLLARGGTLLIADSLLDGTIADPTRRDRDTEAVRALWEDADKLGDEAAVVTRLPLDGGITLVTKR
ncbi:O-methyltransferase [Corynebacterium mayonis]|uniref:O-methyltransferase n=1 Tax=Corynebacterium mayonis TaxID=3062461 RepID=UPI003CC80169